MQHTFRIQEIIISGGGEYRENNDRWGYPKRGAIGGVDMSIPHWYTHIGGMQCWILKLIMGWRGGTEEYEALVCEGGVLETPLIKIFVKCL